MGLNIGIGVGVGFPLGALLNLLPAYKNRVVADSGVIQNDVTTTEILRKLKLAGLLTNNRLMLFGEGGMKTRTSGIYAYASKWYDVNTNDAVQTTELNQPIQSGNIAPNERRVLKLPKGGGMRMGLTAQSFAANEPWSFRWMGQYDGSVMTSASLVGKGSDTLSNIKFRDSGISRFSFTNNSGATAVGVTGGTNSIRGKYAKLDFIAEGNGTLKIYKNGVLFETINIATDFVFSQILSGFATAGSGVNGRHAVFALNAGAISQNQITSEYTIFRKYYTEIETVKIGNDYWATSNLDITRTPLDNIIANVTDNTIWASATTLYDNAYTATSGTVEQKTYAAVKAAAMWSYYNNDATLGAVYGKLYNWYAAKLLQMDIDYYNVANPTTPWGWKVPADADFNTLLTTLGGAEIAGGKVKVAGTAYYTASNLGANNSSGLSALPSGFRSNTGVFSTINSRGYFYSINTRAYIVFDIAETFSNAIIPAIAGYPLRLVKS